MTGGALDIVLMKTDNSFVFVYEVCVFVRSIYVISIDQTLMCPNQFQSLLISLGLLVFKSSVASSWPLGLYLFQSILNTKFL
jgi:hypothetical protein